MTVIATGLGATSKKEQTELETELKPVFEDVKNRSRPSGRKSRRGKRPSLFCGRMTILTIILMKMSRLCLYF